MVVAGVDTTVALFKRTPHALQGHFEAPFSGVPDVAFDVRDYSVENGLVAVRSSMSGSHRGLYNGLAGTGRRFAVDVTDFIRVDGDLIISNHVAADALSTLRQIGVLPPLNSRREAAFRALFNAMTKVRRISRRRQK